MNCQEFLQEGDRYKNFDFYIYTNMQAEENVRKLLQQKLNLYDQIVEIIGTEILTQYKNHVKEGDVINSGKINMTETDFIYYFKMSGGQPKNNNENKLKLLNNRYKMSLGDAMDNSFDRIKKFI